MTPGFPSIEIPPCPQCGSDQACDCEPDGDPRTYVERIADEKAERQADFEREEKVIGE